MSSTIVHLSKNMNSGCFVEMLPGGNTFLSCDIEKSAHPKTFLPLEVVRGSRPPVCENPQLAELHAMKQCAYQYHHLSRCGCPELDPNLYPHLWSTYIEAVKNALLQRSHLKEITLTIFASGYLLQDCELLKHLFEDPSIKNWKGRLNLQFVDLKYHIRHLNDKVEESSKEEADWTRYTPAIVFCICGIGGVIYGLSGKKEEPVKKYALVIGIIMLTVAAILMIAPSKKERKMVTEITFDDSNEMMNVNVIEEFLEIIEQQTPVSLHADFFPSAEACIHKANKSDLVVGYDIGSSKETKSFFDNLRERHLKENGAAILVRAEFNGKSFNKVMSQAIGPKDTYNEVIFTERMTQKK